MMNLFNKGNNVFSKSNTNVKVQMRKIILQIIV